MEDVRSQPDEAAARPDDGSGQGSKSGRWKAIAFLAVVLGLYVGAQFLNLGDRVDELRDWIRSLRPWSPLVFGALYVGATLVGAPGLPLTLVAALVFGPWVGTIVMIVATTVAAAAGFLVARYVARDAVERWLGRRKLYRRLRDRIGRDGLMAVAVIHLVPLYPFSLTNYTFGLSPMPLWKYLLLSELVMIPMNVAWVVGGSAAISTIARGEIPWVTVGIASAVSLALFGLVRLARGWLDRTGRAAAGSGDAPGHPEPPAAA